MIYDLLEQLDGMIVRGEIGPVRTGRSGMNWIERFYHVITEPNIAYLLLSLGTYSCWLNSLIRIKFCRHGAALFFIIGFMALGSLPSGGLQLACW